jgi:hypothetical protein
MALADFDAADFFGPEKKVKCRSAETGDAHRLTNGRRENRRRGFLGSVHRDLTKLSTSSRDHQIITATLQSP